MRLSFAFAALAGLLLAGAATARADAPPAAPIFYCPTPGKADAGPAATPAKAAIHAGAHRRQGCPVVQVAGQHRHGHRHGAATTVASTAGRAPHPLASNDVSASQAFIYR